MNTEYPKYFISISEAFGKPHVYRIESGLSLFRITNDKEEKILYHKELLGFLNDTRYFKEIPASEFALLSS